MGDLEYFRENLIKELEVREKNIRTRKLDISLGELSSMYAEKDLIIQPSFQRLFRWNHYQKTRLIETILVGLPMPSIFVVEKENGVWELIDGLQRLSTIFSFLGTCGEEKKWKLGEGDILKKIKKFSYEELPPRAKRLIRRYTCRVEIISYDADYDVRYELFERLNTGGSPLSDQEIRNAIYRADSEEFNSFLTRNGNENKDFLNLIRISEKQKNELYADELVLRFCALYELDDITKTLRDYLNNYMKNIVKKTVDNTTKINDLEIIFKRTINVLLKLDEPHIFWRNSFSATLYDGIMIGLANNIEFYEKNIELLKMKIDQLKKNKDFNDKYSGSQSHNAQNVKGRIKVSNEIFTE